MREAIRRQARIALRRAKPPFTPVRRPDVDETPLSAHEIEHAIKNRLLAPQGARG